MRLFSCASAPLVPLASARLPAGTHLPHPGPTTALEGVGVKISIYSSGFCCPRFCFRHISRTIIKCTERFANLESSVLSGFMYGGERLESPFCEKTIRRAGWLTRPVFTRSTRHPFFGSFRTHPRSGGVPRSPHSHFCRGPAGGGGGWVCFWLFDQLCLKAAALFAEHAFAYVPPFAALINQATSEKTQCRARRAGH